MRIPQFDLTAQNANTPLLLANLGNTFFSGLEQGQKRRLQGERQRTLADLGRDLESGNDPNFKGAAARLMGLGDMEGALGFLKLGEAAQRRADERGATESFNRLLGGQASTSPAGSASVTAADPNEVQTRFMGAVRQAGVTNPYGLAAIAATGQRESGFSPGNVNRSWSDPSERGQPGMSGGVMSWRGPRLQALQAFAQQRGEQGMGSPETQAAFLAQEDPTLIPRLNQARSAQEAAQIMANAWRFAGYNRPGGEAAARAALAAQYADRFKGGEQPQTAQAPQPPRRPANLGPVQVAETEEDVQRMEAQMGAQPVQMAQAPVQADVPVGGEAQGFAVPGAPQQAQRPQPPALPPGDPAPNASTPDLIAAANNPRLPEPQRNFARMIVENRQRWAAEGESRMLQRENLRLQQERGQMDLEQRRRESDPAFLEQRERAKLDAQMRARETQAERIGLQGDDRKFFVANGRVPTGSEKLTNDQANAGLYADRMRRANAIIEQPEIAGAATGLQGTAQRLAMDYLPGNTGNYLVSSQFQQLDQAQRDFINAVLRRESGAVINPDEFVNARRQYFPQPGDSPQVLEQKARNRQTAIDGISRAGGPDYARQNPAGSRAQPEGQQQQRQPTQFRDGMTATNQQTGERIVYRGGQWVPVQ